MNYDEWKTQNPWTNEKTQKCNFCGEMSDSFYCSKACKIADNEERC